MNWRERAREIQKCPSGEVSKGSKDPFAPFETTQDGRFEIFQQHHAARSDGRDGELNPNLLADFRTALVLGRLVVCGNCASFDRGAELAGLGHCRQFGRETWPLVPFICGAFMVSPKPIAPAYLPDLEGARSLGRQSGLRRAS